MAAEPFDIRAPSKCRDMIRTGALVAINHSGGKDSQAMTILLSRIVPRGQILAVHASLGEVEWPGTVEHIEATLPAGVPLIFPPVASGKTLLDSIEKRGRFLSPKVRWCTSSLKRGPIERELRRYLKAMRELEIARRRVAQLQEGEGEIEIRGLSSLLPPCPAFPDAFQSSGCSSRSILNRDLRAISKRSRNAAWTLSGVTRHSQVQQSRVKFIVAYDSSFFLYSFSGTANYHRIQRGTCR